MSRQASMDQLSEDESASGSARGRRRRGGYRMESQDSTASRDSISRYTEGMTHRVIVSAERDKKRQDCVGHVAFVVVVVVAVKPNKAIAAST